MSCEYRQNVRDANIGNLPLATVTKIAVFSVNLVIFRKTAQMVSVSPTEWNGLLFGCAASGSEAERPVLSIVQKRATFLGRVQMFCEKSFEKKRLCRKVP